MTVCYCRKAKKLNNSTQTTEQTEQTKYTSELPVYNITELNQTWEIVYNTSFTFILNPEYTICQQFNKSNKLPLFIYVHTSPENIKRRVLIRETWAKRSLFPNLRLVFMMGYTFESKTNELLKLEYNTYKDIVQQDFIDSYRNLTYKCIMSLNWINTYCPNLEYIIKTDDDVIVNTFGLVSYLNELNNKNVSYRTKKLICNGWSGVRVSRNKNYKWYISKEEYPHEKFNKYCCGFAILFTGDLVALLYNQTFYTKYFWVDDYYMTGQLTQYIKDVTHEFINSRFILEFCKIEKSFEWRIPRIITIHMQGDINKGWYIWTNFLKYYNRSITL